MASAAPSSQMPVGLPALSRTYLPSPGLAVRLSMPATARPRELTSTVWKSVERTWIGRRVLSASRVDLSASPSRPVMPMRSQLPTSSQTSSPLSLSASRQAWMVSWNTLRVIVWYFRSHKVMARPPSPGCMCASMKPGISMRPARSTTCVCAADVRSSALIAADIQDLPVLDGNRLLHRILAVDGVHVTVAHDHVGTGRTLGLAPHQRHAGHDRRTGNGDK